MTKNPFIPGKKIPLNILLLMDTDDRGLYYWEDQPVFDQVDAERLWGKYGERVERNEEPKTMEDVQNCDHHPAGKED